MLSRSHGDGAGKPRTGWKEEADLGCDPDPAALPPSTSGVGAVPARWVIGGNPRGLSRERSRRGHVYGLLRGCTHFAGSLLRRYECPWASAPLQARGVGGGKQGSRPGLWFRDPEFQKNRCERTHTHTHTCTYTRAHSRVHTRTYTPTYTCSSHMCKHTPTHTQEHTHLP